MARFPVDRWGQAPVPYITITFKILALGWKLETTLGCIRSVCSTDHQYRYGVEKSINNVQPMAISSFHPADIWRDRQPYILLQCRTKYDFRYTQTHPIQMLTIMKDIKQDKERSFFTDSPVIASILKSLRHIDEDLKCMCSIMQTPISNFFGFTV